MLHSYVLSQRALTLSVRESCLSLWLQFNKRYERLLSSKALTYRTNSENMACVPTVGALLYLWVIFQVTWTRAFAQIGKQQKLLWLIST